jgi:hypothetical protein
MKLGLSLDQLKILRRPEAVLVLLILVVAVAWVYLDRQSNDAKADATRLDRGLRAARDDLKFLEANSKPAGQDPALQQELERLQSAPRPASLPSREDALKFSNEMLSYASKQGLPLSTFEIAYAFAGDFPIVRYSVVARGDLVPLVGALKLLQDFPTATVQGLRFTRIAAAQSEWELKFELDVLHRKEGA